jgi:hypothetical protein
MFSKALALVVEGIAARAQTTVAGGNA